MINKTINITPYIKVNLVLGIVLLCVFIYSAIFSAQGIKHPIPSLASADAASIGLSRAFSEIVRGDFIQAQIFNSFSIKIFIFFAAQFTLRIFLSVFLALPKIEELHILFFDIVFSVMLFIYSFKDFILAQIQTHV